MPVVTKDPAAVLDYAWDWAAGGWLAAGETIAASTWTVRGGITQDSDSHTTTTATIWLSGGKNGTSYTVTNQITTNQGRTDERTFTVKVVNR